MGSKTDGREIMRKWTNKGPKMSKNKGAVEAVSCCQFFFNTKNHWGHLHQVLARIIRWMAKWEVLIQRWELCTKPSCPGIRFSVGLLSWKEESTKPPFNRWSKIEPRLFISIAATRLVTSPYCFSIQPFIHSSISFHTKQIWYVN